MNGLKFVWNLCRYQRLLTGNITFNKFTSGHTGSKTEIKTSTQGFHFIISTLSNGIILAIDLYFSTCEREKKRPRLPQTAAWRPSDNRIHKATGWMKRVFFLLSFSILDHIPGMDGHGMQGVTRRWQDWRLAAVFFPRMLSQHRFCDCSSVHSLS